MMYSSIALEMMYKEMKGSGQQMKIWKGIEQEGPDKGIMTLFVKDDVICSESIKNQLMKHPDCKRLYLGAGRTDVIGLYPENDLDTSDFWVNELLAYCRIKDISVVVEVSFENMTKTPEQLWESVDRVIVRLMSTKLKELVIEDCIKLDDEKNVYIAELQNMIPTSLEKLSGDTFVDVDTIIYNDEEE